MQVHKKLGNTHLALINFSWATDLDPKGTNNHIKEALDKRCMVDDDDADDNSSNLCMLLSHNNILSLFHLAMKCYCGGFTRSYYCIQYMISCGHHTVIILSLSLSDAVHYGTQGWCRAGVSNLFDQRAKGPGVSPSPADLD